MDVLRKELNELYASQHLECESLDPGEVQKWTKLAKCAAELENDCCVITDAASDECAVYGGRFAEAIGLQGEEGGLYSCRFGSSDEDMIYSRLHPEDLVDKRWLEYEFFKYIDSLACEDKTNFKAVCRIRILNHDGQYIYCDNTTEVVRTSPRGMIWLILCTYRFAADSSVPDGIDARILNTVTGEIRPITFTEPCRNRILTSREKEVLLLIRDGWLSKQIASRLGISIHTVNRHRQNILEKLSVGNSVEAVKAAMAMKLL